MRDSTLVGLTGGIGAGKSTVARMLAVHGARIVDGDEASRAVVDPSTPQGADLLARISALLSADVITADGALDRAAVAARVFRDADLLTTYNALLRPAVLHEVHRRITEAIATPGIIVHEIPLLSRTTAPLPWGYDLVVTVEASESVRLQRLQHDRGHDRADAERRLRAQGLEADRVAIADVVIRTDGDLDETRTAVDRLWTRLSDGRQQP